MHACIDDDAYYDADHSGNFILDPTLFLHTATVGIPIYFAGAKPTPSPTYTLTLTHPQVRDV